MGQEESYSMSRADRISSLAASGSSPDNIETVYEGSISHEFPATMIPCLAKTDLEPIPLIQRGGTAMSDVPVKLMLPRGSG